MRLRASISNIRILFFFFLLILRCCQFPEYTAASNSDGLIGHDFEENERDPITILPPHLHGGTRENHEKPQSG
jgi:hypothetical protein